MKVYFALNSTLYSSNEDKVTTTLNKMSEGQGANFAEMWYDKLADPSIPAIDKIFDKFTKNFETTFYSFDTRATARLELSKLVQKFSKTSDGTTDNGFQKYITDFLNIASKAGITDDITLIDQFSLRLDQHFTIMILSITPIPMTITDWIDHTKTFHTQKQCILVLRGGCSQTSSFVPCFQRDPNAMDVDAITIAKLTPSEHTCCFRKGLCLRCQHKGHNANNCKAFPSTHCTSPTQNIHNAETSSSLKEKQHTKLDEYVNFLKTSGKTDDEIFSTLRMYYKEPEELAEISTYPAGVHKAQDF